MSIYGKCDKCGLETIDYICGSCELERANKAEQERDELQRQLDDPDYQYAGSRIHRKAIECRNEELQELYKLRDVMKTQLANTERERDELQRQIDSGGTGVDACCHGFKARTPAEWERLETRLAGIAERVNQMVKKNPYLADPVLLELIHGNGEGEI